MKPITSFFKGIFALGLLGLVMLVMVGVIIFIALQQGSYTLDTALDRMQALNVLEGDVLYALNDLQLNEGYYVFAIQYEYTTEGYLETIEEDYNYINQTFDELRSYGHFGSELEYAPEISDMVDEFQGMLDAHIETFQQLVEAISSSDDEGAFSLLEQSQGENADLKSKLSEVTTLVDQERRWSMEAFPEENSDGILITTLGAAAILILALMGYLAIAGTTRGLRNLSNAITAIGGDRYRPDLLGKLPRRVGPVGALARALNRLAEGLQQRSVGLKAEVERLRQQLYESRRKRLKLARPAAQEGGRNG